MIKKRSVSQEAEGHTYRAKQTRLFKRKKVKKKKRRVRKNIVCRAGISWPAYDIVYQTKMVAEERAGWEYTEWKLTGPVLLPSGCQSSFISS